MRLQHGTLTVTTICGDLNAHAGMHAYPAPLDSRVDRRGVDMCTILRSGGFELLPSRDAVCGIPAPVTRGSCLAGGSMLDYVWVALAGDCGLVPSVAAARLGSCLVHADAQCVSDHSLLEISLHVPAHTLRSPDGARCGISSSRPVRVQVTEPDDQLLLQGTDWSSLTSALRAAAAQGASGEELTGMVEEGLAQVLRDICPAV